MTDITQGQDASAGGLPDEHEMFPDKLPDADELFPDKKVQQQSQRVSPIQDMIFSDPGRAHARILDAFGYGFKQDWGAGEKENSAANEYLRKAGIYNDYSKGQRNIIKAANEAIMRPAIATIATAQSVMSGTFHGVQAAIAQTGEEYGAPQLGREVAGGLEAFPTGIHQPMGVPHLPAPIAQARELNVIGSGEAGYFGTAPVEAEAAKTAAEAAKVQDVAQPEGLPGHDAEAGPSPVAQAAAPAPEAAPDIHAVARQIAPDTFHEFDALAQKKDTFRRWIDELREVRDENARTSAPHAEEIADLEAKLADATPRLAKKYRERLEPLVAERDRFLDEQTKGDSADMAKVRQQLMETDYRMRDLAPAVTKAYRDAEARMPQAEAHPEPTATQTPEAVKPAEDWRTATLSPLPKDVADYINDSHVMALPSGKLIRVDPETGDRYRFTTGGLFKASGDADVKMGADKPLASIADVEEHLGKSPEIAESPTAKSEEKIAGSLQAPETPVPNAAPPAVTAPAQLPIAHTPSIVADVSQKLKAAGRPAAEADAAAQIVAAYWETRAQRFEGAKGTAAEMYAREAPEIVAGKEKARVRQPEMAQTATRQGRIRLREDGRATISLLKNADASTFIHETGHDWLERMLDDARDEEAPQALRDDAQTVLKWLGAEGPDSVKTRHHEKFARGFETYMLEGRAPSSALARVFAQFRDWLTTIYKTAAALKAPISDDIRAVFDRLLAEKPEKTVIAPERESAPGLTEKHGALAEATAPEKAHEVANTIEAERDSLSTRNLVESQDNDTRLSDTGAEAERRAPGGAEPPGDADASGSIGRETEAAGGPGGVGEGGSKAAAEGARAREKPEREPLTATEPFARADTRLIDKAGNIRLENVNAPEDVLQVLRDSANRNNGFYAERRGVISDSEALSLAQALGEDPAFLDRKAIGTAYTKEEVFALEDMLIKSATKVRDAMAGTDEIAYAEAKARHMMIHDMVQAKSSAARAEAGRTLQAFAALKRMKGAQDAEALQDWLKVNTGKTLYQAQQEMKFGSKLPTPTAISKFLNDSSKKNFHDAIVYYYVNALISGPITHARYSVGNAINAIWKPLVELPTAATIGALKEVAGIESKDRVYYGEAAAQLYAITKGSRDGLSVAIKAFQDGVSPALPGERVSAHFAEYNQPIPGTVGNVLGYPGRSVAAIHSFFKQLRYEQEVQSLAYRKAMEENLSGDDFHGRVAQLTSSPTPEMMENSTKESLKELFMAPTDYHSAMGSLTRAVNKNLLAKIIIPFMKIGSQITRNAFVERTPLGLASKSVRDVFSEGGASADLQAAKMVTGVALMGATVLMAAEEMATGDGPTDPKARAIWLLNHRPNSIAIGGITMPYQGLGHLGMLMRFSANMYETGHYWDGEDGSKLAVSFFEGLTKSVIDENFLRGVKDMLDAVYHPEEYGASYLRNSVTAWIPWSVGLSQIAKKIDPYERETHTIFEAARAKIPFVSMGLFPRRDRFGEPIPNGGGLPQYQNDPVVQMLEKLNLGIAPIPKKIRGVELTEQQHDDFARVAGRMTKMMLNAFANTPGMHLMPDQVKRDKIHDIVNHAREIARVTVIMQPNSNIMSDARKSKIAPLLKAPTP